MKVIDENNRQMPGGWHLLEEEGELYLYAYCSHSFVDYMVLMALTEQETRDFQKLGQPFLDKLAYDVHMTATGVIKSRSRYKSRSLMDARRDRADAAIEQSYSDPSGS